MELDPVELAVVLHVRAKDHVFVEIPGVQERSWQILLTHIVVDVILAYECMNQRHERNAQEIEHSPS